MGLLGGVWNVPRCTNTLHRVTRTQSERFVSDVDAHCCRCYLSPIIVSVISVFFFFLMAWRESLPQVRRERKNEGSA